MKETKVLKSAIIQVNFGTHKSAIKADIVDANVLRFSMEKKQMWLHFDGDTIIFNDLEIPLETTPNGLSALPITAPKQLINKFDNNNIQHQIFLWLVECKSDTEIALKLHHLFPHPSIDKLLKLIAIAGKETSENGNLKRSIKNATKSCEVCKKYKKPPPRPHVSLPMWSQFQGWIAVDLKQYEGWLIRE